jgi:hypothetical protein
MRSSDARYNSCMRRILWIFLLSWLWVTTVWSEAFQPALFPADAPTLKVSISAPWEELVRKRKSRPEYEALVSYTGADGELVHVPATVTTRGRSRLKTCRFPPLRLDFKKKDAAGTLFAGQKKLKLVTRCKRNNKYADYLKVEFLIYRAYNLLTDNSFRVRMLKIDYLESSGNTYRQSELGFFLEDRRSVAARLDLKNIKIKSLQADRLDSESISRLAVFQYLAGNTDWSMLAGPPDEDCCHNGILLGEKGSDGGWIPVPYDFDQSGMIDAEYAAPGVDLPIRTVRTRLYRGFCTSNAILDDRLAEFMAIEPELRELFESADLSYRASSRAVSYVSDFFKIINDPASVEKKMRAKCR